MNLLKACEISGYRRGVDEVFTLWIFTQRMLVFFCDVPRKAIGTFFKGQGIDRLSRNVGRQLQTHAA